MVAKNLNTKVLVVDDDEMNLEILRRSLTREGFMSSVSHDGEEAWEMLSAHPEEYDVVLLDKMMPKLSGMEVLARMKRHPILRDVPVIMQTGDIGVNEAKEGIAAGAYYYLTKPFDPDMMIAIVNSAIRNFIRSDESSKQVVSNKALISMMDEGKFTLKDIKSALSMASAIASMAKDSHETNIALLELLINAIEHGNLCIGYSLKKQLFLSGGIDNEIEKRLKMPEHKDKHVYIHFKKKNSEVEVTICDEGQGFNWREFMDFDPVRLMEPNGRSIAIIKNLLDVKLQYHEPGNKVVCTFKAK